jgi:putative phosphoribosyl transferase
MTFKDRADAGKKLALKLKEYKDNPDVIVIGLPRGGVVVAAEVAHMLNAPLEIIVSRKVRAPHNPELAIGAVSETGEVLLNEKIIALYSIAREQVVKAVDDAKEEAQKRVQLYRAGLEERNLKGKTIIIVDDGIATGYTMLLALKTAQAEEASAIIMAAPICTPDWAEKFQEAASSVVCLDSPENFEAVSTFYKEFEQISDEEVLTLLGQNT